MAQHGYLREYDEGWDRGDDRERGEREWRERSERDWRSREQGNDRGRGFMFDDRDRDRERDRYRGRAEDRGFFSRMGDEARSWFGDDDDRRSDRGAWENNRDWPQRSRGMGNEGRGPYGQSNYSRERGVGGSNEWRENRSSFSSHPDDHYRSWRHRQMQSLDRDYEDYCREREQQFHQDFDSWRQNRQQQRGSQGQPGGSSEQVMELDNPTAESGETQGAGSSPTGAATLGTNNSENSTTGRGRR